MRRSAILGVALVGLALVSKPVYAQQWDDQFRWYIGAQAGVLGFETPSQTRAFVPTGGASLVIRAKRTGLMVSLDEAFGSEELTGYSDVNVSTGVRRVTFDRLRKYSAMLTANPLKGATQPYFGFGFGLLQVVNPKPQDVFTSPQQFTLAKRLATSKSTDGFMSVLAGVQARVNGVVIFGQYQITSSPSDGNLLRGPSHGITGGIRVSLGGAKEGIKGGGY
ncbi:MAG: hypothetical protein FJ206_06415 [Gemmatimonadetes bacterium]|nr:hypothetical protein [Gemmatimonadota bacterium]